MKVNLPVLSKIVGILFVIAIILVIVSRSNNTDEHNLKKIMLLQYNDSPLSELSKEGIIDGLEAIGYVEGVDFKLKALNAQGDVSTLNIMVDGALNDNPDLIFVTSTPTLQVVARKIKNIPVVFTVIADPVAAGVGSSFSDHMPNITGISTMGDYEGMAKWLKIIMSNIKTVGTIFTPGELNSVKNLDDFKNACTKAGIELLSVPVNSSTDVNDAALSLAGQKPDVICQIIDNLTSGAFSSIAKVATDQNIPLFGFVSDQAKQGAAFVVSRNYYQAGVDAVGLAQKIFDGQLPQNLPFEFVSKTDVIINEKAANYFGVSFPEQVLEYEGLIKVENDN
ncbi:MAG TPA: ABC transporter substrate-binding protein [Prolixibacteraceae bacterium]|nr:ABC transporter substrate-binding protein [Prolixibacteraceae bacterium]